MSGQKIIDGLNEAITFAKAIAEATATERERCARIAEEQQLELVSTSAASEQPELTWRVAAQVTREAIAKAIRNPTPEAS